jgi:8-oxo-dGTP pyrophosphatase MutT (NUDIX family)
MAQDELLDIIDEQGNVVEVATKQESHRQGLLHKTVIAEVIDSAGRWLMVKQSALRQDAGQYVSPVGGHVASGESEMQALKREAMEEVGITGDFKYEYVGRKVFDREVLERRENHLFIVYKIYSDAAPVLNYESESCKYFTEKELQKEIADHPECFGAAFHFVVNSFFPNLRLPMPVREMQRDIVSALIFSKDGK